MRETIKRLGPHIMQLIIIIGAILVSYFTTIGSIKEKNVKQDTCINALEKDVANVESDINYVRSRVDAIYDILIKQDKH